MERQSYLVLFGFGSLATALALTKNTDLGFLVFGYDNDTSSGIIVADGHIVSSKIIDIDLRHNSSIGNGYYEDEAEYYAGHFDTITVTYADPKSVNGLSTYSFDVLDSSAVFAYVLSVLKTINKDISTLLNRVQALENTTIEKSQSNGLSIESVENETSGSTFKIKLNIDNETLTVDKDNILKSKGYTYAITEDTNPTYENVYRVYNLMQTSPSGEVLNVGEIEIPSAQVLKDVDPVWAIHNSDDTYTEVAKGTPGSEVYLKFIWNDDDREVSYINISDLASHYYQGDYILIDGDGDHMEISVDITSLARDLSTNLGIGDINNSIQLLYALNTSINSSIINISNWINENTLKWLDLDY